jgi:hypothetical protein
MNSSSPPLPSEKLLDSGSEAGMTYYSNLFVICLLVVGIWYILKVFEKYPKNMPFALF